LDELDGEADHIIATLDGVAVGTGRLLMLDESTARIGRMAVLPGYRGRGIGGAILSALIERARLRGGRRAVLAGQMHAIPFYARHGFEAYGDEFDEAGIVHRMMSRSLTT
jgi:predicted GNAT family N-acyltransferase